MARDEAPADTAERAVREGRGERVELVLERRDLGRRALALEPVEHLERRVCELRRRVVDHLDTARVEIGSVREIGRVRTLERHELAGVPPAVELRDVHVVPTGRPDRDRRDVGEQDRHAEGRGDDVEARVRAEPEPARRGERDVEERRLPGRVRVVDDALERRERPHRPVAHADDPAAALGDGADRGEIGQHVDVLVPVLRAVGLAQKAALARVEAHEPVAVGEARRTQRTPSRAPGVPP